jgi:hypothetical protein
MWDHLSRRPSEGEVAPEPTTPTPPDESRAVDDAPLGKSQAKDIRKFTALVTGIALLLALAAIILWPSEPT